MIDNDTMEMAEAAKAERDAEGRVDERADLVLALYRAGVRPEPFTSTEQLRAMVADPSLAPRNLHAEAIAAAAGNQRFDDGAPRVRRGGEPASNQFGTFTVHQASDKQIAFAKRLLAEKDLGDIKVPADIDTISKKAASALIDRLMARPAKATSVGTTSGSVRLASDKQMAFLKRLMAERDYYSLVEADRAKWDAVAAGKVPTAKGASEFIDTLTGTAYAPKPANTDDQGATLELGMYRKADGTLYRVYPGRESGRLLAKRLVLVEGYDFDIHGKKAASFEYAGMASRFVTADERMSLEEAKAFGHQFGICCVCGALLTDPESVERGIGPVCGSRV